MLQIRKWLLASAVVGLVVAVFPLTIEACPTCKEGISENGANLVRGFGWSIIFMMSMPFLILGGISSYFYLEVRRAQRQQRQDTLESGSARPGAAVDTPSQPAV